MHHCTQSNHGYASLPLKRYFDPFRRFCAAHPCAQHTQITLYSPNLDTGVNPGEDAGDTSPNILFGGTSTGISPQYYYVLLDIADQYWLPSVRSASSRFHSAIRRHQFASVRQADSRLTRLAPPPTLNSR